MEYEVLTVDNFNSITKTEDTKIRINAEAAQPTVTVENVSGFAADNYVLVGNPGSESAQILKVLSVAGNDITFITDLTSPHSRYETVIKLTSNKIKFYRADNVDGTAPAISDFENIGTAVMFGDQITTEYMDTTGGGTDYWYRYTYYNDVTYEEIGPSNPVRGSSYNRYASIDQVRITAGIRNNKNITDGLIEEALEGAESQVKASLSIAAYTLPLAQVPPLITLITRFLAAGLLLIQYPDTQEDGMKKIEWAEKQLERIQSGKMALIILPSDETVEAVGDTTTIAGYPDSTAENLSLSEERKFSMNDEF